MELGYEESVNAIEVGKGETSGKKMKLHLTLTQIKNEKSKKAAGSRLVPSLYLSDNVC